MKIALVIPSSPFLIDQKVFPFLGPLYLSAVLKQAGHNVTVYDLAGREDIPVIEADIIGVTATTPQFPQAIKIASTLKDRHSSDKIIIGGPHASAASEEAKKYFDMVCVGEGERWITGLADGIKDWEKLPIEDLDQLPFPDWDAIDLSQYQYFIDGKRTMSIMTSRGCP
jgi:radical SAM superfamily enzyme YgiQ (UPF0313 family)